MPKRLLRYILWIAALSVGTTLIWSSRAGTETTKPPARPRLVILIIIDQFRNEYLDRFRPYFVQGGFNRLMKGARFTHCSHDYAVTFTGPGHASIATGTYPNIHGIIGNDWYDRTLKRPVNCVEDPNTRIVDSAQGSSEQRGASPRYLLGSTLGDELRLASNFQSKVFSVSLKDRGAVLSGGHTANAAYWYDSRTGRFVSSTYYMPSLPAWVAEFNDRLPAKDYCGKAWKALPETPEAAGRVFAEYSTDPSEPCPGPKFLGWLSGSPFVTEIELKFTREVIRREKLGQSPATDLLTISLSANDHVGHRFGPYSPQLADMTLRTDRELAGFFEDLDRMLGLDHVWIVLSADHGVAPTPQLVRDRRLGHGTFQSQTVREAVEAHLSSVFGTDNWVEASDLPFISLNQDTIKKHKISSERVEAEAAWAAVAVPGVFAAYTRTNLLDGSVPASPIARKALNSFHASRSGDIFLVLEPFAVPSGSESETTHGTPWSYDAQVPLLLWGSGFRPGTYADACEPIDLAATLAVALGLASPSGATGSPLSVALPRN